MPRTPSRVHVCFHIADIDRSVAFFKALGLVESGRITLDENTTVAFLNEPGEDGNSPMDGDYRIELYRKVGVENPEIGNGYRHVGLNAADLDGALARLAEQGIEPEYWREPPFEGAPRICFVRDPDGYLVELLER